jgi:choline-glycine betaine transporter
MRLERTIGAVTALVVGAVTALAFAQSFHALRTFAEAQQVVPARWGWMFAATIDGFVLAALLTSLSLSLQGDRGTAPGRCACLP